MKKLIAIIFILLLPSLSFAAYGDGMYGSVMYGSVMYGGADMKDDKEYCPYHKVVKEKLDSQGVLK